MRRRALSYGDRRGAIRINIQAETMDAKPALSPFGSITEQVSRELTVLRVCTVPRIEPPGPLELRFDPRSLAHAAPYTRLPQPIGPRWIPEQQQRNQGSDEARGTIEDPDLPNALDLVEKTRLAVLLNHQSKYPAAPALIRQAWNSLVPAIIELSHHQDQDALTLTRTVRRARKLKPLAHKAPFLHEEATLDAWLLDVLVLLGTIPVEGPDVTDRFIQAGTQRLQGRRQGAATDDGGLSAPGRNEALMCLELLCAKAWYARNRENMDLLQTKAMLYAALQFMYWECGLPPRLPHLLDATADVLEPFYAEIRAFNYRQLYNVERAGLLPELLIRVHHGIAALNERREHYHSRFQRYLRKDVRWTRDFKQHTPFIAAKYAVLEDGRWSVCLPEASEDAFPDSDGEICGRAPVAD